MNISIILTKMAMKKLKIDNNIQRLEIITELKTMKNTKTLKVLRHSKTLRRSKSLKNSKTLNKSKILRKWKYHLNLNMVNIFQKYLG